MPITIAVCTYRRFDLLQKCLASIRNQTLTPEALSVIVVDNSLAKKNESIAFRDSLSGFPHLEYVITDTAGLSHARNVAMKRCRTSFLSYIDDDACAAPDWAEKIVTAFERYPGAGVIGGRVNPVWEKEPPDWLKGERILHTLAVVNWGEKDMLIDSSHNWLVGANVSYRTDILRKCGGFNTSLGRKGSLLFAHEELATNIAIQAHGYNAMYIPSIKVDHFIQGERTKRSWFVTEAFWEGASRVIYEVGNDWVDADGLSTALNQSFIELKNNIGRSDETRNLEEVMDHANAMGRKACRRFIGHPRQKREHDYYFHNIVSVIYIVTPCMNAVDTINRAIISVLSQAGDFSIRFHVQDGGSTDGTLESLADWKRRFEENQFPLQCNNIVFTFSSGPDDGKYDALAKGFSTMSIPPCAFMTVLDADGILMPGAFAFVHAIAKQFTHEQVSWVSGATYRIKDGMTIRQSECIFPAKVIDAGLCDGLHWDDLRSEGTFFRGWLWERVNGGDAIRSFIYAGDWNLWRLFAVHTALSAAPWPLAASGSQKGRRSQAHREQYQAEIESVRNTTQRDVALQNLVERGILTVRSFRFHGLSKEISLVETNIDGRGRHYYEKCFKRRPPEIPGKKVGIHGETILFSSRTPVPVPPKRPKRSRIRYGAISGRSDGQPFFIVTPCLNAVDTIDRTMQSVLGQAGDFTIRYHMQDGGSTDDTVGRLKKMETDLVAGRIRIHCRGVEFSWATGSDNSMYEAVSTGFDTMPILPEDFMTWINADDRLLPNALSTLGRIAVDHPNVQWVGGPQYVMEKEETVMERLVPTPTILVREGLCDGRHWPFLQQEGMFFKKGLWFRSRHALTGFSLAGDWSLWREFACHSDLFQYPIPFGAFCRREGQLSIARHADYQREIDNTLPFKRRAARFARLGQQKTLYRYVIQPDAKGGTTVIEQEPVAVRNAFERNGKNW